jgi:hypothetical protein
VEKTQYINTQLSRLKKKPLRFFDKLRTEGLNEYGSGPCPDNYRDTLPHFGAVPSAMGDLSASWRIGMSKKEIKNY